MNTIIQNKLTDTEYNIACKIKQRRLQILIHGYIYYELHNNIISDYQWDIWKRELCILQKAFPDISRKTIYYKEFSNINQGKNIIFRYDSYVKNKAKFLLKYKNF